MNRKSVLQVRVTGNSGAAAMSKYPRRRAISLL